MARENEKDHLIKRLMLIVGKFTLPDWEKAFPSDPLGSRIVDEVARVIQYGPDKQAIDSLSCQILSGKYGDSHPSLVLGNALRRAGDTTIEWDFYRDIVVPIGGAGNKCIHSFERTFTILSEELMPWLIEGSEVSSK
jgi:hypothetical protein